VDHDDAMLMLRAIATAFDEHDLNGIMAHFADDAVFEGPRGPDPLGTRFVGREAIREAFAARFSGIPDIRYQGDEHFVDGDRGHPSGPCPERRPRDSGSRSGPATCGPFAMARS
jgi:ketosteroid isomerase-like protein